jgi:hypothetical protein
MTREPVRAWRRSTYCGGESGCLELSVDAGVVLVRDATFADGPELRFPSQAWRDFVSAIRADQLLT